MTENPVISAIAEELHTDYAALFNVLKSAHGVVKELKPALTLYVCKHPPCDGLVQ